MRNPRHDELSQRHAVTERVAYFMDRVLSRRWSFFLAMSLIGFCMVCLFGALTALVWECSPEDGVTLGEAGCDEGRRLIEGVWIAWTFMADPGTHANTMGPVNRVLGSVITLGGILFMASILGVMVDMVREKMDALRQGKSKIVERDHTLILGWTEKTMHIIEELINANASEGGGVVCVLAPETKEHMEAELAIQLPVRTRKRTRIILRSGSPLVLGDLVRVSVHTARAIMVLAATGDADRADADTLRTMLLLRTLSHLVKGHVVAEVRDIDNEPLVSMVGGSMVDTLVSHDMVGRLMLLSARQPGLAKVYEALLGFEGDEFYKEAWPELEGVAFRELQQRFPDAVPIGIYKTDGTVCLLPQPSYMLQEGDQVMVLAEDNDTYKPTTAQQVEPGPPPLFQPPTRRIEKIMFCGWRRDIRDLLQQLDKLVELGSEVHMMTHCIPLDLREESLLEDGLDVGELKHIRIVHHYGNTSVRRKLEGLPIETYTSCMIFADQVFEADTMHADSHSLATLLLIRDIQAARHPARRSSDSVPGGSRSDKVSTGFISSQSFAVASFPPLRGEDAEQSGSVLDSEGSGVEPLRHIERHRRSMQDIKRLTNLGDDQCPIVCEILDPHTQRTIADSKHLSLASDFCQTNRFIAQVMTMVAEDRTVKVLLDELLGNQGASIAVVPSERYIRSGEELSFFAIANRAHCLGEIVIGYQLRHSIEATVLNPPNKHEISSWDRIDFAILERGGHACDEGSIHGKVKMEEPALGDIWGSRMQRDAVRERARENRSKARSSMPEFARSFSASDGGSGHAGDEGPGGEQPQNPEDSRCLVLGMGHSSRRGGSSVHMAETSLEAPIPEESFQKQDGACSIAEAARGLLHTIAEVGATHVAEAGGGGGAGSPFRSACELLDPGERRQLGKVLDELRRTNPQPGPRLVSPSSAPGTRLLPSNGDLHDPVLANSI